MVFVIKIINRGWGGWGRDQTIAVILVGEFPYSRGI